VNHHFGNNPEDKQLIDRILRGDNRAFGSIIKNTENLVAGIVFKMIPLSEDRKDLAQDIYLKVFHHLPRFQFKSKLSTWIATIAYNTCLSWIARKKLVFMSDLPEERKSESYAEALYNTPVYSNPSEIMVFQKELSGILGKEIENLPVIYQTLIMLFHQESMTYEEMSQVTGLPEGTVKSSLFRARKMLKENLLLKYQKEAL
jgi:RNA polymerase sigma factor (sigma-70 family)